MIVDEIHMIEIETTTHELFLDDSPEEFIIRASNEEGNWSKILVDNEEIVDCPNVIMNLL